MKESGDGRHAELAIMSTAGKERSGRGNKKVVQTSRRVKKGKEIRGRNCQGERGTGGRWGW